MIGPCVTADRAASRASFCHRLGAARCGHPYTEEDASSCRSRRTSNRAVSRNGAHARALHASRDSTVTGSQEGHGHHPAHP